MSGESIGLPGSQSRVAHGLVAVLVLACLTSAVVGCSSGEQGAELERLLVRLPLLPEHPSPDDATVSFSDLAELKRRSGFPEGVALEDVPASLMDDLSKVLGLAAVCPSIDAHVRASHARMDLGYDVMAVRRCMEGSGVTWLEGDFDRRHVVASLEGLGYEVDEYQGVTTCHFNADRYTGDEAGRELAAMVGHVAVLREAVVAAATPERLHAALDAWKGRTGNLSDVSRYAALVQALGPVVGARLWPVGDRLVGVGYQETAQKEQSFFARRPGPCEGRDAPSWIWTSRESAEQTRYIVLVSTYASTEEASVEGERLSESLVTHSLAQYWQAVSGPTVMPFEEGAVLSLFLELKGEAPADILGQVISVVSGGLEE